MRLLSICPFVPYRVENDANDKHYLKEIKMRSVEEYKTVSDVISDLNVMIVEAPITNDIRVQLADIVGRLLHSQDTYYTFPSPPTINL